FTEIAGVLSAAETLWNIDVMWADLRRAKKLLYQMGLFAVSQPRDRRVTQAQVEKIKAQYRGRLPFADMVDVSVCLGLRESEVVGLRWADIDKNKRLILVRDRKHPRRKFGNHQ